MTDISWFHQGKRHWFVREYHREWLYLIYGSPHGYRAHWNRPFCSPYAMALLDATFAQAKALEQLISCATLADKVSRVRGVPK